MPTPASSLLGLRPYGTQLYLAGRPFRNFGVNHFSLMLREMVTFGAMTNPGPAADFAQMQTYGIRVVRTAFGWYDFSAWRDNYVNNKAAFYAAADKVIAAAEQAGMGLIVNLAWSVIGFSQITHLLDGVCDPVNAMGDPNSNAWKRFRTFVQEFVGRYRDSPAIYAWQVGNEMSAKVGNEWYRTWACDGSDPVAGTNANMGLRPDGTPYPKGSHMTTERYARYCRMLRDLFAATDPHARILLSGNAIGTSYAVNARRANTLAADVKAQWDGGTSTEMEPWIAYRDREFLVIEQHLYPGAADSSNTFFGDQKLSYAQWIAYSKQCADAVGKPLVLAEWGSTRYGSDVDPDTSGNAAREQANFAAGLAAIQSAQIPLACLWNWDGQLNGTAEWQRWKLTDPTRVYQLAGIAAANAAL